MKNIPLLLALACSLSVACSAPPVEEEDEGSAESIEDELTSVTKSVTYSGTIVVDGTSYPIELTFNYPSAALLSQIVRPEAVSPQNTHACYTATGGALVTTRLVIRGKNGAVLVDNASNGSIHGHAVDEARTPAQCVATPLLTWSMQATAERNGIFWDLGARRIQVGGIIGLNGNPGIRVSGSATYRRRSAYEKTDLGIDSQWNAARGVLRPMLDRKMLLDVTLSPGVKQQVTLTAP